METIPTLDTTEPLAKRELAWLARLPRHIHIASARLEFESDEPDEAVTVPAAPRRQRKRSLTKVCEAARKAGADRVIVDGVVIVLAPSAAVPESDANEWDEKYGHH